MAFSVKYLFILLTINLVICIGDEIDEEPVPVMATEAPVDDGHAGNDSLEIDDLNSGGSNVSCHNYTSCKECVDVKCYWAMCGEGDECVAENKSKNCALIGCTDDMCPKLETCEDCAQNNCSWEICADQDTKPNCVAEPGGLCRVIICNGTEPNASTTAAPETTTTTDATTTMLPITTTMQPTTEQPNPTTTDVPDPTTDAPATTQPPTTVNPITSSTTTAAPTPAPGGFSTGSFFGGIILTLTLIGVGVGGYKFYKLRYDVNYRTL